MWERSNFDMESSSGKGRDGATVKGPMSESMKWVNKRWEKNCWNDEEHVGIAIDCFIFFYPLELVHIDLGWKPLLKVQHPASLCDCIHRWRHLKSAQIVMRRWNAVGIDVVIPCGWNKPMPATPTAPATNISRHCYIVSTSSTTRSICTQRLTYPLGKY